MTTSPPPRATGRRLVNGWRCQTSAVPAPRLAAPLIRRVPPSAFCFGFVLVRPQSPTRPRDETVRRWKWTPRCREGAGRVLVRLRPAVKVTALDGSQVSPRFFFVHFQRRLHAIFATAARLFPRPFSPRPLPGRSGGLVPRSSPSRRAPDRPPFWRRGGRPLGRAAHRQVPIDAEGLRSPRKGVETPVRRSPSTDGPAPGRARARLRLGSEQVGSGRPCRHFDGGRACGIEREESESESRLARTVAISPPPAPPPLPTTTYRNSRWNFRFVSRSPPNTEQRKKRGRKKIVFFFPSCVSVFFYFLFLSRWGFALFAVSLSLFTGMSTSECHRPFGRRRRRRWRATPSVDSRLKRNQWNPW